MAKAINDQDVYYKSSINFDSHRVSDQEEIIDKNLVKEMYSRKKQPDFYYIGQKKTLFSRNIFISWLLVGMFHAGIIFVVNYYIYKQKTINDGGHSSGLWSFSLTMFTSIIFVIIIIIIILGSRREIGYIDEKLDNVIRCHDVFD
jgi:magnesium-transporting ATPase (P-type)